MGLYKATATDSKNFKLTLNAQEIGSLVYKSWYSFTATVIMNDGAEYILEPKGFWDSNIELKDGNKVPFSFSMGWKGIVIKSHLNETEESYLLSLKGLLSNKFILQDSNKEILLVCESDITWTKLNYNYTFETTAQFDKLDNSKLFTFTVLHAINYYMTMMAAV